jgi:carboxyl-terminal processing protease
MDYRSPAASRPPASGNPCLVLLVGLSLGLFALVGFTFGVLADRAGFLPGAWGREPAGVARTFAPFWETWHLVEQHYVDREAVSKERMTEGAIEGMLDSLGDRGHTTYLTAKEYEQMESGLQGEMEGIGARMSIQHGHQATIMGVVPNSPAEKAGLRAGDVFLEVDGKDVTDMSLERIVSLVRGPAKTTVHLQVLRDGKKLDFDITRGRVEVPNVSWHMLPGEPAVAHIAIEEFGRNAQKQLQDALRDATKAGAKGLLVDVRGNPGGLKDQAVAVTSEFLKDGVVFIEQDAQGHQKPIPVDHPAGAEVTDLPLVLLIDQGTASSAEIFAGAIQDHGRGKLVGTRTFGTGTVLMPYILSDRSAVLLAVSEWLTPNGRKIWHEGIQPDVQVALPTGARMLLPEAEGNLDTEALAKSEDKQLLKALEVLKDQLK